MSLSESRKQRLGNEAVAKLTRAWPGARNITFVRFLGKGAFGSVHLVEVDGSRYVLKACLYDPEKPAPKPIRKEELMSAVIDHPRCDRLLEVVKPLPGVVLFFRPGDSVGVSLTQFISEYHDPPPALINRLVLDILEGLAYMHSIGIAHCDIKPDNIIVRTEGGEPRAVLTDFGLASRPASTDPADKCNPRAGSPRYRDPRLGGSRLPKHQPNYYLADIYALAASCYWMTEGKVFLASFVSPVDRDVDDALVDAKLDYAEAPRRERKAPAWVLDVLSLQLNPTAAELAATLRA